MGISLRPNETREMRLFSKVVEQHKLWNSAVGDDSFRDLSLPQFIARRRAPGDDWKSWDEIRYELRTISGEIVTDGTLRKWAQRYGIPQLTQADGDADEYGGKLQEVGIEIPGGEYAA